MSSAELRAGIEPHMVIMGLVFASALVVGYMLLPGENERVAMLERDGKNLQALGILEARFDAGDRRARTLYQLVGLYEQFGQIPRLKTTLEALAEARPRDVQVRRRLAQFYSATQDNESYLAALEQEIDVKYSEAACRELIGLHRLKGEFVKEQAAIVKCRQRGYRRAEDVVRLAELFAADGDAVQAAQLLRNVDDLKRLKSDRERLQLFTMLVEADQPKEAQRRAVRWIKVSRDKEFTLTLIETLVRSRRHDDAIALARETSQPGDAISLTVAEIMLDRGETVAARAYLRGWAGSAKSPSLDTTMRFNDAALDAEDAETAFSFSSSFGLARLPQLQLVALAEALSVIGRKPSVEAVRAVLTTETLASNPLLGAAEELGRGQKDASRELLNRVEPEKLDAWKLTLWARLMQETGRGGEAQTKLRSLGVVSERPADTPLASAAVPAVSVVATRGAAAIAAKPAAEQATRILRRKKRAKRFQVRNAVRPPGVAAGAFAKEPAGKEIEKDQKEQKNQKTQKDQKDQKSAAPSFTWPFSK